MTLAGLAVFCRSRDESRSSCESVGGSKGRAVSAASSKKYAYLDAFKAIKQSTTNSDGSHFEEGFLVRGSAVGEGG